MKRSWMVGLGLALAAAPGSAATVARAALSAAPASVSAEDSAFAKLSQEYKEAFTAWDAQAKEAKSKKEKAPERIEPTFWPRFEQLANKGDKDAMLWCLANLKRANLKNEEIKNKVPPMYGKLVDALLADEKNEKPISLEDLTQGLIARDVQAKYLTMDEAQGLLKRIVSKAKEDNNKAAATMMSALLPVQALEDEAQRDKQSLEVYRDIAAKFPKTSAGAQARGQVNQLENLVVGKTAPEFATTDVEGVDFKLTDYRGKVVVIDFWGFW